MRFLRFLLEMGPAPIYRMANRSVSTSTYVMLLIFPSIWVLSAFQVSLGWDEISLLPLAASSEIMGPFALIFFVALVNMLKLIFAILVILVLLSGLVVIVGTRDRVIPGLIPSLIHYVKGAWKRAAE